MDYYDYSYDYTGSTDGMGVFLAIYFVIIFIFSIIPTILMVIGMWKTFKKMDEPGWKSIIPFYNFYIIAERCSTIKTFKGLMIAYGCAMFFSILGAFGGLLALFAILFVLASYVLMIVYNVKLYIDLFKSFDYGSGYAIGYLFFPFIFGMILGCSSKQYIGNTVDSFSKYYYGERAVDRYSSYGSYGGYQSNSYGNGYQSNSYGNGYQSNSYGNSYQNNSYNNGYQNSGMNNSYQQSGGMNNSYQQSGGMNNAYQQSGGMNNAYQQSGMNNSYSNSAGMADLEIPEVNDDTFAEYERNLEKKSNNTDFMNGI